MSRRVAEQFALILLMFPLGLLLLFASGTLLAQDFFDQEPINYSSTETNDPVAKLQKKIDAGELQLKYDERFGYLPAVLDALEISTSSQTLVFSKTSLQLHRITPRSPRALYYNDDSYIGWVQNGDVVEVSSVDPQQGTIFYTLSQEETEKPKFVRDQGNCLICHASSRTLDVPGLVIRSVYPAPSGQPYYGAGTYRSNHKSPFEERYGGWYVTGFHGKQRHMGNMVSKDRSHPENLDIEAGANLTDLSPFARIDRYLTKHSDLVALMVLTHQADMHNYITAANFEGRRAVHYGKVMNRALDRPEDFMSESTKRRISSTSEKLLKYLLFSEEATLTDRIEGSTEFAKEFSSQGIKDKQGRSLRDFDLQTRMFKYPCSYLIHSESFLALPIHVKEVLYTRLHEVLSDKDQTEPFSHLSSTDRKAILEILLETHSDFAKHVQKKK